MGKLNKEELILLYLQDPEKVLDSVWENKVKRSAETRQIVCSWGAKYAYYYALNVDKKPHADTRTGACRDLYDVNAYNFLSNLVYGEETPNVQYHGTTYKRLLQAAPNLESILPKPPSPPYVE